MKYLRMFYCCISLKGSTMYLTHVTFFFILKTTLLHGQTISTGNLFEFYMGDFKKNIRISKHIQEQWNLPKDFLQPVHYNANIDPIIPSAKLVNQVLFVYYDKNGHNPKILELIDDGNHFDNEAGDGIFGNYLCGDFDEFKTDEANINVSWDTLGINYHILQNPVQYLPEVPNIIAPTHQSVVSSDEPIFYWKIDTHADGCGAILLESIPILGSELTRILWEKEYHSNRSELFVEKLPLRLINSRDYTLLIWSYTDTKQINNEWSQGAYSIEWCKFTVDIYNY